MWSGDHFPRSLWAYNLNLTKNLIALILIKPKPVTILYMSGELHVMACANCDFIELFIYDQHEVYNPIVKWVPGPSSAE